MSFILCEDLNCQLLFYKGKWRSRFFISACKAKKISYGKELPASDRKIQDK